MFICINLQHRVQLLTCDQRVDEANESLNYSVEQFQTVPTVNSHEGTVNSTQLSLSDLCIIIAYLIVSQHYTI